MFQLVRMLGHKQQQEEITLLSVKQQCKNNSTGGGNTYIGAFSGAETGTGGNNLAAGRSALFRNVDGSGNVALGREASLGLSSYGESPNNIVAIGYQAAWSQNGLNGVVFFVGCKQDIKQQKNERFSSYW
ncbi:hypothetical protein ABR759_20375 [Escherichia coli]